MEIFAEGSIQLLAQKFFSERMKEWLSFLDLFNRKERRTGRLTELMGFSRLRSLENILEQIQDALSKIQIAQKISKGRMIS